MAGESLQSRVDRDGPLDPKEILRIVRERNALTRLTIHTITFGNLNQLVFLKKLASENGGRHHHIE